MRPWGTHPLPRWRSAGTANDGPSSARQTQVTAPFLGECRAPRGVRAPPSVTTALLGRSRLSLAERWNGRKWSIQPTPHPQSASLAAVSCPSPTTCIAVGSNDGGDPLVEQWDAPG